MSKQGWRDFLGADGLEDWVVLHGGATAVFRLGAVQEAAQLAGAVRRFPASRARARGADDHGCPLSPRLPTTNRLDR
jgi:hypothetical protein